MKKISFIVKEFPSGGIERVVMNLARPLTALGYKLYLFVYKLELEKMPSDPLPIEYIQLPYKPHSNLNKAFVEEAIRSNGIEVFFSPARFPAYLAEFKNRGLCKVVFALHSRPFYEEKEKAGAILHPKHNNLFYKIKCWLIDAPKLKSGYYYRKPRKRYRWIYENVDAFAVLFDDYGKAIAQELGIEYSGSKFVTLKNPISPMGCMPVRQREKCVLFVGRLSYWDKRVDRLLAAWELVQDKHCDWTLKIVGDGEEGVSLRKIVADKKLQRVFFMGFSSAPEEYYRTAEILALSSDVEGCPMVLLEAQSCGCATIAFDCSSGVREILSPNWRNGVYVPNDDIKAYADALSRLMGDDELRRIIQANGRENIKRFSAESSAEQYHKLIERIR